MKYICSITKENSKTSIYFIRFDKSGLNYSQELLLQINENNNNFDYEKREIVKYLKNDYDNEFICNNKNFLIMFFKKICINGIVHQI